jgi:energy-coupling factor transporter ATP-binding protein EcfA2
MIKSIYLLVFVVFYFCLYADAEKSLTIKHNNTNYDLISFIEKYKKDLNSMTNIKKKIIMVLGMTSSGKSTLINYLNNIPLICSKTQFNKYILELEFENKTLPGGFAIGHKIHSQTFIPAGYTPPGKDFSFIDNPGFKDTHGLAIEIANGFFREQITRNANEIKFLLLLPFDDLTDKGLKFRASIKAFSRFVGAFKDQDTKNLSKSIGIIITKVEHDGVDENTKKDITKTDEQMKYILKFRLKEILQDEEENRKLSKNEHFVFNEIIENDQFEIFSNPKIRGPVGTHQANEINNFIINKLKYSNKDGLKIRVEIDEYKDDLFEYVHYFYSKFENDFNHLFETAITKYFNRKKFIKENFQNIHIQLSNLKDISSEENDLDDFLEKLNLEILKIEEKKDLKEKKEMFSYFIHLFSESEKKIFTLKKIWLNDKNKSKILHFINILELDVLEQFKEYLRFVSCLIQNGIDNFVERKINNAVEINDIYQLIKI